MKKATTEMAAAIEAQRGNALHNDCAKVQNFLDICKEYDEIPFKNKPPKSVRLNKKAIIKIVRKWRSKDYRKSCHMEIYYSGTITSMGLHSFFDNRPGITISEGEDSSVCFEWDNIVARSHGTHQNMHILFDAIDSITYIV